MTSNIVNLMIILWATHKAILALYSNNTKGRLDQDNKVSSISLPSIYIYDLVY